MKVWDNLKKVTSAVFAIGIVVSLSGCDSSGKIANTGDPTTGWSINQRTGSSQICFKEDMIGFNSKNELPSEGVFIRWHAECVDNKVPITDNPRTGWNRLPDIENYTRYEICYGEKVSTIIYIRNDEHSHDSSYYYTMTDYTSPDVDCS